MQLAVGISGAGASESIVHQVLGIAAFTNGPILGIFLLAALTRRVSENGALIGLALGIIFMLGVQFVLPRVTGIQIAWPWFVLIGSTVTFACGCAVGFFWEKKSEPEGEKQ